MSREPLKPTHSAHYERHASSWICGDAEIGDPCPLGPSGLGVCSRQPDCSPIKKEGRWYCGRSTNHGGPCATGPSPKGDCGRGRRNCVPKSTLRKRRFGIVLAVSALTFGIVMFRFNSGNNQDFVAPGPLTDSHGLLLTDTGRKNRCAACHVAATRNFTEWTESIFVAKSPNQLNQSDLCLNCHRDKLSDSALFAHSLPPADWSAKTNKTTTLQTANGVRSNGHGEIACSTCHQEHHGANHDLSALSNRQCNNCHERRFENFENAHPEFDDWPRHQPAIRAAHAVHQAKHFPEAKAAYNCRDCHQHQEEGEVVPVVSFSACAQCHEDRLKSALADGIQLVSFPMLDVSLFATDETADAAWPTAAQGAFDGPVPALMKLLLLADPEIAGPLAALGPDFDFLDIMDDDAEQLRFCERFMHAVHRLCKELDHDVEQTIKQRLTTVMGTIPSDSIVDGLTARLPQSLIRVALRDWLPEPLMAISETESDHRFTAAVLDEPPSSPSRGWYRDSSVVAIRYRPEGHADRVVQSLIELALTPVASTANTAARETLAQIRESHIAQQCFSCHVIRRDEHGVYWKNDRAATNSSLTNRKFTKFSHRPHLVQPQLRDCNYCHTLKDISSNAAHADASLARLGHREFASMSKAHCATCHVPQAAGDGCLKCHNYHVTPQPDRTEHAFTARALEDSRRRRTLLR